MTAITGPLVHHYPGHDQRLLQVEEAGPGARLALTFVRCQYFTTGTPRF
jgi:hypothetical protein